VGEQRQGRIPDLHGYDCYSQVVQEACLAPTSLCLLGRIEIPLDGVLRCAAWLVYKSNHLSSEIVSNAGIRNAVHLSDVLERVRRRSLPSPQHSAAKNGLMDFVGLLGDFNTYDPRDHIYGLLGLYQTMSEPHAFFSLIVPDYNTPLSMVLRDATRYILIEE